MLHISGETKQYFIVNTECVSLWIHCTGCHIVQVTGRIIRKMSMCSARGRQTGHVGTTGLEKEELELSWACNHLKVQSPLKEEALA